MLKLTEPIHDMGHLIIYFTVSGAAQKRSRVRYHALQEVLSVVHENVSGAHQLVSSAHKKVQGVHQIL